MTTQKRKDMIIASLVIALGYMGLTFVDPIFLVIMIFGGLRLYYVFSLKTYEEEKEE